jgi:hypothetical protein
MQMIGVILLALVGICLAGLIVYSLSKNKFEIGMPHAVMSVLAVVTIVWAFFPSSNITIGTQGISAQVVSQKRQIELLDSIIRATATPEQKALFDTLSQSSARDEWVKSSLPSGPIGDSHAAASLPEGRTGGGGRGGARPTHTRPEPIAVEHPITQVQPWGQSDPIENLSNRGILDIKTAADGSRMIRVKPNYITAAQAR